MGNIALLETRATILKEAAKGAFIDQHKSLICDSSLCTNTEINMETHIILGDHQFDQVVEKALSRERRRSGSKVVKGGLL
jgi:hypothetical protein